MAKKQTREEKVRGVADAILSAFKEGRVPQALSQVFLDTRPRDSPVSAWSWRNQLIVALRGEKDARGYHQWLKVGRNVKRGESAFYILAPCTRKEEEKDEETGEMKESIVVTGFLPCAVFGHSQTEGRPLPDDEKEREFLDSLPLLEVARSWGLTVTTVPFHPARGALGSYGGDKIMLSVENPSTWAHELVHAADDRLGAMEKGDAAEREVVAELGGAILLECLGYERESDRGGAWEYVRHQAESPGEALKLCTTLIERTCAAVALILDTSRQLSVRQGAVISAGGVS